MQIIDFYVSVIDNYGDMGFAINFAFSLHQKYPDLKIRFFSDDFGLFQKFLGNDRLDWMEYMSLEALKWDETPAPSKLICSFFDYRIPKEYLARFPYPKTIVSFSYFLLHEGLESLHGTKYVLESGYDTIIHFVSSLLMGGWGVIINPEIELRKEGILRSWKEEGREVFMKDIFSKAKEDFSLRSKWQKNGVEDPETSSELVLDLIGGWWFKNVCEKKWVSVFVYKESLEEVLEVIEGVPKDVVFFIFWSEIPYLDKKVSRNIIWMPFLSLEDYGVFQSLCDANIVRGENSLCQGLISGKPVLWDIYKENNGAHTEKIGDYLSFLAKQFPDMDWDEYSRIMREFNEWKRKMTAFSDFISGYSEYEGVFVEISEYVKSECDLVEKFEKIL